jgi:squalene-hopene/tetraprenyl-beta-curcumene cyclase
MRQAALYLQQQQQSSNHWSCSISPSPIATSLGVVALQLQDASRHAEVIHRGRQWLIAGQHPDGGWGEAGAQASDADATYLALAALHLTETDESTAAEETAVERAHEWLALATRRAPGAAVTAPQLHEPCASIAVLAGLLDRRALRRSYPELLFLPVFLPARLHGMSPVAQMSYIGTSLLHTAVSPDRSRRLPTRKAALSHALEWLTRARAADSSFAGSPFLSALVVAGLLAAGQRLVPWLERSVAFLAESQREDGSWTAVGDTGALDTALAVLALRDVDQPLMPAERIREWILRQQSMRHCWTTDAPPGGWPSVAPGGWPDTRATTSALLALRALDAPASLVALRRGAEWLARTQTREGGWRAYGRASRMPYDQPCPLLTVQALQALHATNRLFAYPDLLRRALGFLARAQRYDGSFASVWCREATLGTAGVIEGLAECGLTQLPFVRQACDALLRLQNDDGGWGGVRLQPSTAEETAAATLALLCAPTDDGRLLDAALRGVWWLLEHQRADGAWEPAPILLHHTGAMFASEGVAATLALRALGRAMSQYQDEYAE